MRLLGLLDCRLGSATLSRNNNCVGHRALLRSVQQRPLTLSISRHVIVSAVSTLNPATKQKPQFPPSGREGFAGTATLLPTNDDTHVNSFVYTRFHWPVELGGEEISVWGSFNGWTKGIRLHRFSKLRPASVVMLLQPGNYEFKYVVDDLWMPAPFEPMVTNCEGHLNNFRIVAPSMDFRITAPGASQVLVVGDWDDWQYALLLKKDTATGVFSCQAQLKAGQYSYHYVVDDEVVLSSEERCIVDADRGAVHKDWSYDPQLFRIYYCTGWDTTILHYRRTAYDEKGQGEFSKVAMVTPNSRGSSVGTWRMATIVPSGPHEQLEFYLSNGEQGDKLKEDKPGYAPLYHLPSPSSFKLCFGQLRPFSRGSDPRIMVVSDLDGTMFGDVNSPDAFDSSHRFLQYWEGTQALAGSLLVYNTGRSLGQFVGLMKSCDGRVAVPDVLITAVGTKVWRLDVSGRRMANGCEWIEDLKWARLLDQHWNLGIARKVAHKLVNHYNDPGMAKIADDGSEHQHRIALIVDQSALHYVSQTIAAAFLKEGLEVRIITSGAGSHRYVDCVPVAAGKEKALQYVRQQYGIPEHLCVAAGDSGNDILMLEGEHPAVVVGNAQSELVNWLVQQPQDGKVIYTDAFFADGIMEGLARHGLY